MEKKTKTKVRDRKRLWFVLTQLLLFLACAVLSLAVFLVIRYATDSGEANHTAGEVLYAVSTHSVEL